MKKQYVTTGIKTISSNFFRKILRPLNNYTFKPNGGLWAAEFNKYSISDWYEYMITKDSYLQTLKSFKVAAIFTLKDDAKILTIDSCNQIKELAKKYPSYHHILGLCEPLTKQNIIFDFEELAKDYDGVYVDYYKINFSGEIEAFKTWSVNTLLLFNISCIESYQSIDIIPQNPFDSEDLPKIVNISNNKLVNKPSAIYMHLYQYTKKLFKELLIFYPNITDYNNYLEIITENIKRYKILIANEKEKEIKDLFKILENEHIPLFNERQKEIVIYNIILNYLSEYLIENKDFIKELPKSKIKQKKWYEF